MLYSRQRALGTYLTFPMRFYVLAVDLWLDYAIFMIPDRFDSDEALQPVRGIFERAIMAVGLHVAKGGELWDSYRETEQAYLGTLVAALGEIETPESQSRYQEATGSSQGPFPTPTLCSPVGYE